MKYALLAVGAFAATATPASAAFISIDDSNIDSITITAGDFENGFSVNGALLTTGLGNSDSITLADGGYTISGSWIDLGEADGDRVDVQFALPGDLTFVTSGIEFGITSDGFLATLAGSFGGFFGSGYFVSLLPALLQNGQTGVANPPFLSVSFISEIPDAIPEPAALGLFGLGLAGLGLRRRTRG